MHTLSKRGSFYTDEYWRQRLGNLNLLFMSHAGHAYWLATGRNALPPEVRDAGDAYLAGWDRPSCSEEFAMFKKEIRNSTERTMTLRTTLKRDLKELQLTPNNSLQRTRLKY